MSMPPDFDWQRFIDAQGAMVGLSVAPEHRPGVARYLQLVAAMAPRVTDFALTPDDEPANVFTPVSPPAAEGEAR